MTRRLTTVEVSLVVIVVCFWEARNCEHSEEKTTAHDDVTDQIHRSSPTGWGAGIQPGGRCVFRKPDLLHLNAPTPL